MLNKSLKTTVESERSASGTSMFEFVLAGFLIAIGLCLAGAATHLYQAFSKETAMLRYDGKTYLASVGHVLMSFVCGPYIMLQLGWRHTPGGAISTTSALLSALVAFGWSFMTGLMFLGAYFAVRSV
jgi:hypothetical protein